MMKFSAALVVSAVCLLFFATSSSAQPVQNVQRLWGVAYGVDYLNCPTYDKIYKDMQQIKTYSSRVRIYACFYCNNICYNVTKATQELGMEVLIGLQPAPANEWAWELLMLQQISDTIGFGGVVGITVGSETIYRKDMTTTELAKVIIDTRTFVRDQLGSNLPIGSADIHNYFDEVLTNAVDEIYINSFPYWIGINPIDVALKAMFDHYDVAVSKAKGKPVIWGEMGWPTKGHKVGEAEATPEKLRAFLKPFTCECKLRNQKFYWFSAYDRDSNSAETEANWGLFYTNGQRKDAFEDFTCDDYVSTVETPGDATKPDDWKDKATHDADWDGKDIKSSSPNPAPSRTVATTVAPTTLPPTTLAPATSQPEVTSNTDAPVLTSEQVATSTSDTPIDVDTNAQNQDTQSGFGRQQNGSASLFVSSSLLIFLAFLFL
eukprot:TRINITY_DN1244_c0_g1_i1.p1 TRINITY_DN1244_c0_g1~~TRINITY_DN1244_c0_g1_i1.p1  ORF type:complete len:433 (-),score=150.55 TRINITY_DN1244_c0_g1_i1:40-1338(-)